MGANNCTSYSDMHLQEANLLWVKFSKNTRKRGKRGRIMARVQFKTGNEQYGNLANLRKAKGTGKQVGETLAQPTGQIAHVEGSSTVPVGQSQPAHVQQPVVTDNTIAQLNAQQETERLQKQLKQATIEHEKLEKRIAENIEKLNSKEEALATNKKPGRTKKLKDQVARLRRVVSDLCGRDAGATQKIVELQNKLNIPIKPQAAQIATPVETAAPKATTSTVKAGEQAVERTASQGVTSTIKAGEHAAESSVSQGVTRAIQSEEAAAAKGSKGFFSKVAKFFKGKKGIAAGIGAAVAIGAAVVATKSCNSGDTTTPTQPVATPVDTTKTDSAKAQPVPQTEEADKPQAAAQPKAQTTVVPPVLAEETEESNAAKDAQEEQELQEADEADKAQQAEKEHEAQKGDTYWGYAKFELIAEHQGEPNYKPTNAEITERMHEIMKRNGAKMDKDGIHPLPMLNAGDKVKVKAA